MEPTYKRVCRVIAELAGTDADSIGPGQSLGQRQTPNFYWQSLVINSEPPKPIGFDSLDLVQLAMALEEEFDIAISDDEVDSPAIDHVGGLVAFVQGKLDAMFCPSGWMGAPKGYCATTNAEGRLTYRASEPPPELYGDCS